MIVPLLPAGIAGRGRGRLIGIRKTEIIPRLAGMTGHSGSYELIGSRAIQNWTLADGAVLSLVANLSPDPLDNVELRGEDHLWLEGSASGSTLAAWSVCSG